MKTSLSLTFVSLLLLASAPSAFAKSATRIISRVAYRDLPFVALTESDRGSCKALAKRASDICALTGVGSAIAAEATPVQSSEDRPFTAWEIFPRNVIIRPEHGSANVRAIFSRITCSTEGGAPAAGAFGSCK